MKTKVNISKVIRGRIMEVVQKEFHPETGEKLITEAKILEALNHKSIKKWAYVWHDKDRYTTGDEVLFWDLQKKKWKEEKNQGMEVGDWERRRREIEEIKRIPKAGSKKDNHVHIVLECDNALDTAMIARWFGVPKNCIEIKKGHGAFWDSVAYITHEHPNQQAKGKHRYEDEEIKANFDWRKALSERNKYQTLYEKYGNMTKKELIRCRVLYEGLSIRQLCDEDPLAYQRDYAILDKFRYKYIMDRAPMPRTRINYYVCGKGGIGKGLICRAIARSLYPELKNDEDIFFEVGAKGVPFEGYDGQPVIIWNDRRAIDLLQELNGRGNVFNVFDTHPVRAKQNVKYSSICLCNTVNIVNSVQSYSDFLDGLAGEYKDRDGNLQEVEDKGQSYRRFPFIIPLHENDFDLLMNKGFYEGTREYEQYIEYNNIRGNFQKIAERCGADKELEKRLQGQAVQTIVDKHNEILEKMNYVMDEGVEAILAEFADVGKMVEQSRIPQKGTSTSEKWINAGTITSDEAAKLLESPLFEKDKVYPDIIKSNELKIYSNIGDVEEPFA